MRTTIPLLVVLLATVHCLAQDIQATGDAPRFTRHVVPVFSKLGCNSGQCHGAVQGKNGFRLSLFGVMPRDDHAHLMRDDAMRRLNLLEPQASLLLRKPSGEVPHLGGKLLDPAGRDYAILRDWITAGAKLDAPAESQVQRLVVSPDHSVIKPGGDMRLRVEATFADGSSEDVTAVCSFTSQDEAVAQVDAAGVVHALAPGDAPIVIRYRSLPAVAGVLVPAEKALAIDWPEPINLIDEHVLDKLRRLNIPPTEVCDDAAFLRRVSLDITGALPTPDEIRAFLDSDDPDKRTKKIDELLKRPGHSALWATKFCDVLRPQITYTDFGDRPPAPEATRRFYEWIRARLRENRPYDEIVERMLIATSLDGRSRQEWIDEVIELAQEDLSNGESKYAQRRTLDLYWHRYDATGVKGAIQVAHAFLGLRLQCAECHRHPSDVWTQDDLLSFANFFTRTRANIAAAESPQEAKRLRELAGGGLTDEEKEELESKYKKDKKLGKVAKLLDVSAVYHALGNPFGWATTTSQLGTQASEQFRLLGEAEAIEVADEQDPRPLVVAWMRKPDNPFFAKAIVNRVWAHYFGRGIVEPADHLSPLNPPSHPELLQELCDGFIANNYDLRWLHRTILTSRTYQQSARPHADNPGDTRNYSAFYRRRMPAEILVDAINHATGGSEKFGSRLIPADATALEIPGRLTDGFATSVFMEHAFTVFGKPLRSREAVCDCERESQPTLEQSLFVANHPDVIKKISDPRGRVAQILKDHSDNDRRIDEIYLWTCSRLPREAERQICQEHLKNSPSAEKGFEGLMWSLLNSSEFLLNH